MGHLNGILARVGGNLNNDFQKCQMPGGLPGGGGMLKLRFDRYIIGKANRSLGFIRKNLSKCPENVKQQAYLALVRPQLEYMDVAHMIITFKKQIKDIESTQRRAARFVKNEYGTTPGTITKI